LFDTAGPQLESAMHRRPRVRLLTGSIKGKERTKAYGEALTGELDIIVGTQALIQDKLEFARMGLVIVEEQHRFGVRQRLTLRRVSKPSSSARWSRSRRYSKPSQRLRNMSASALASSHQSGSGCCTVG